MNNGLALFLGVAGVFAFSWGAFILPAHWQLGRLGQYRDPVDETLHPSAAPGLAAQGGEVYADLGCVYCHTQQVRQTTLTRLKEGKRAAFNPDFERKWAGDANQPRPSYARDYIQDRRVFLGQVRLGPDLRNVGTRFPDDQALYKLLFEPQAVTKDSLMPPHAFLFETRPIVGERSAKALAVPAPPGCEVVPTPRAEALAAYLLNLKDTYDYPEERRRNMLPSAAILEGDR
ncbi:MAG: cbb3-type cytochrome c oxidase subunit II [Opitutaceae bacterium]|nr:cbb3-type cytochrome c oxidase subunit II [Opitutaceae bacterium]